MKIKVCTLIMLGVASFTSLAFCQQEPLAVEEALQESVPSGEEISWVWGEIKAIDTQSASLTVIYMDYQTDEEKELMLITDAQTKYEGAKDMGGIKAGDTASIDFVIKDDKNIARNISIENIEAMPEAPGSSEEPLKENVPEEKI